jgi:hypothetical protein
LAVIELIYLKNRKYFDLKTPLKQLIISELTKASNKNSVFELVWLVFFSRYIGLGITNFSEYKTGKNPEIDSKSVNDLETEAIRVIKLLNGFTPAEKNGKKVSTQFTFPINFVLDEKQS